MEKYRKITRLMVGAVIIFVLCFAAQVLGFIPSDNLLVDCFSSIALLILGLGALIGFVSTIRYFGIILGHACTTYERRNLGLGLSMIISIFAFVGVGLIGYTLGEFCNSQHIHLSADIVDGFSYIMEALGMIMASAFSLWTLAHLQHTLNKHNL